MYFFQYGVVIIVFDVGDEFACVCVFFSDTDTMYIRDGMVCYCHMICF